MGLQRVLIAEDHPMYADALEMALAAIDRTIHVVKVETLAGVLEALGGSVFDLAILDPGLIDSTGAATVAAVRGKFPDQAILVISANDKLESQRRVRDLGARGFVSKASHIEAVIDAIQVVEAGGTAFDAELADDRSGVLAAALSQAQLRVLAELATGNSNKEIAYRLGLAEPTVKSHMSAIMKVLGATNRSQAILALRQGELI